MDDPTPQESYYASGWSPYDINDRKGMNYGGMPQAMLVAKMEVSPDAPGAPVDLPEEAYDAFARATITDWGPDAPLLGDDDVSQGSGNGAHRLNYQYNGSHGSTTAEPRHPEIFYDFSNDDTPGGAPRMEDARRHMARRIRVLAAGMGDNDDHHTPESEYTQVAQRRDRKAMLNWVGDQRKIFSIQRQGRDPLSGLGVADVDITGTAFLGEGGEGVDAGAGGPTSSGEGFSRRPAAVGSSGADRFGAAARSGAPDAFFGGGSNGRSRGVERFGAAREGGRAALVASRADSDFHRSITASMRHNPVLVTQLGRATAAGRAAKFGGRFGGSTGMGGRAARATIKRPGDFRKSRGYVDSTLPGVAVDDGNDRAHNLGRRLRTLSAPAARRAMQRGISETYAAAATDATTADGALGRQALTRTGIVKGVLRHDGAESWTARDAGQRAAKSAGREALPAGGYGGGKRGSASREDTDLVNLVKGSGVAAGGGGGGSGYGKTGGNPVGRGAAPSAVVPDELDFGA